MICFRHLCVKAGVFGENLGLRVVVQFIQQVVTLLTKKVVLFFFLESVNISEVGVHLLSHNVHRNFRICNGVFPQQKIV